LIQEGTNFRNTHAISQQVHLKLHQMQSVAICMQHRIMVSETALFMLQQRFEISNILTEREKFAR